MIAVVNVEIDIMYKLQRMGLMKSSLQLKYEVGNGSHVMVMIG